MYTNVAESASIRQAFFYSLSSKVSSWEASAAVATSTATVVSSRRAVGGGVSSYGNAVVGDVTTSMRIYAGVRTAARRSH